MSKTQQLLCEEKMKLTSHQHLCVSSRVPVWLEYRRTNRVTSREEYTPVWAGHQGTHRVTSRVGYGIWSFIMFQRMGQRCQFLWFSWGFFSNSCYLAVDLLLIACCSSTRLISFLKIFQNVCSQYILFQVLRKDFISDL